MEVKSFEMVKEEAQKLWKEYVEAVKKNPKDQHMKDMKAVYNQLKCGRKVIEIGEAIRQGGLDHNYRPKLAIAKADVKTIKLIYRESGTLSFQNRDWWFNKGDVEISGMPGLPERFFKRESPNWVRNEMRLESLVPAIPASICPKNKKDYYVLWEVDKWSKVEPPKDPWLLRRLTNNMFVVVAGWDLTELERAVMKGRLHV